MIYDNFQKKLTPINLKCAERLIFVFDPNLMRLKFATPSLFILIVFFAGCNSKELARLQSENDSLRNELASRHNVLTSLKDVRG